MQRVASREFQRRFGHSPDEALGSPLSITCNGRDRLLQPSHENRQDDIHCPIEYHRCGKRIKEKQKHCRQTVLREPLATTFPCRPSFTSQRPDGQTRHCGHHERKQVNVRTDKRHVERQNGNNVRVCQVFDPEKRVTRQLRDFSKHIENSDPDWNLYKHAKQRFQRVEWGDSQRTMRGHYQPVRFLTTIVRPDPGQFRFQARPNSTDIVLYASNCIVDGRQYDVHHDREPDNREPPIARSVAMDCPEKTLDELGQPRKWRPQVRIPKLPKLGAFDDSSDLPTTSMSFGPSPARKDSTASLPASGGTASSRFCTNTILKRPTTASHIPFASATVSPGTADRIPSFPTK